MTDPPGTPPRLLEALLRRVLGENVRGLSVIGDLREEYREMAEARSPWAARAWYLRQTVSFLLRGREGRVPRLRTFVTGRHRREEPRHRSIASRADSAMDGFLQDFRYALRMMRKRPGFTLVIILTLAVAIGVNSAVFSLVNDLVLTELSFGEPNELVFLTSSNAELGRVRDRLSYPDYLDFRERVAGFEDLAALTRTSRTLTGLEHPTRVAVFQVSVNFFSVARVDPIVGRDFHAEDLAAAGGTAVLLSHGAWTRLFGADPEVVGRRILLDDQSHVVAGIMPKSIEVGRLAGVDLWTLLPIEAAQWPRDQRGLLVMGRLRDGVSLERARAEVQTVAAALEEAYGETNAGWRINVADSAALVGRNASMSLFLTLLSVFVGFILLIACSNVATLLLARHWWRKREIALRVALGAGKRRLLRQLLTESALLAIAAGGLGLLLASWSQRVLVWVTRSRVSTFVELSIDSTVLAFTLVMALVTPILFGLMPALRTLSADPRSMLADSRTPKSGTGRSHRWSGSLIVVQVSLAVVLVVIAGLNVRSTLALAGLDLGFNPANLLTLRVELSESRHVEPESIAQYFQRVVEEVATLSGVLSAGLTSDRPIVDAAPTRTFTIASQPLPAAGRLPLAATVVVTPSFFETLQVPVLRGRLPEPREDATNRPPEIVISRAAAQRYWPDDDAIGARLKLGGADVDGPWMTVVAVVGDLRNPDADQPPEPHLYVPFDTEPRRVMALMVRTESKPLDWLDEVRARVWSVDPDVPLSDTRSMAQIHYDDLAPIYALIGTIAFLAVIAMMLASAGIYGLISYSVAERRSEIGIRMALGAQHADVVRTIMFRSMWPTAIGIGLGLVAAFGASRMIASLLFGTSPVDTATYIAGPALLALVALLASLLAAFRATRVDPFAALRSE